MTRVKTFIMNSGNHLHHERLERVINHFLEENDVEVIDIKYSTAINSDNGYCVFSAMMIYNTK